MHGLQQLIGGLLLANLLWATPAAAQPTAPIPPTESAPNPSTTTVPTTASELSQPDPEGHREVATGEIGPLLALTPNRGAVGTNVTASIVCNDDVSSSVLTIAVGGANVQLSITPSISGIPLPAYSGTFIVPDIAPAAYTASVCGASAPFTVLEPPEPPKPILTVDPAQGRPGSEVVFTASNLPRCRAGWTVGIDQYTLDTISADSVLEYRGRVPALDAGHYTASVTCSAPGNTASAETAFEALTSPSPPTSTPSPTHTSTQTTKTTPPTTPSVAPTTAPPPSSGNPPDPHTTTKATHVTLTVPTSSRASTPPSTSTPPDADSPRPVALLAAIALVSTGTITLARARARTRKARRWVNDHVHARERSGPTSTHFQPSNQEIRGPSLRLETRTDTGNQIFKEDHHDRN